jgi:phage shock protein E
VTRATLFLALVLSLTACSGGDAVRRVTGGEAHALVAAGGTLLDVRSAEEFAAGHLEGAVLVPVDELAGRLAELPRERPVVVYCRSGGRSARAAAILGEAGYGVHDLGGMSSWDD